MPSNLVLAGSIAAAAIIMTIGVLVTVAYVYRPPWETLGVLDCNGDHHGLSSHALLSYGINLDLYETLLKTYSEAAVERGRCHCPALTQKEAELAFKPSVSTLVKVLTGELSEDPVAIKCDVAPATSFTNGTGSLGLQSYFLADALAYTRRLRLRTSDTFSAKIWDSGSPLMVQIPVLEHALDLQLTLDHCPDRELPFVSLTCRGPWCRKFAAPCSDSNQCGAGLVCKQFTEFLGSSTLAVAKHLKFWEESSNGGRGICPETEFSSDDAVAEYLERTTMEAWRKVMGGKLKPKGESTAYLCTPDPDNAENRQKAYDQVVEKQCDLERDDSPGGRGPDRYACTVPSWNGRLGSFPWPMSNSAARKDGSAFSDMPTSEPRNPGAVTLVEANCESQISVLPEMPVGIRGYVGAGREVIQSYVEMLRPLVDCRTEKLDGTTLTDTQLESRFLIYRLAWEMHNLHHGPDFDKGADIADNHQSFCEPGYVPCMRRGLGSVFGGPERYNDGTAVCVRPDGVCPRRICGDRSLCGYTDNRVPICTDIRGSCPSMCDDPATPHRCPTSSWEDPNGRRHDICVADPADCLDDSDCYNGSDEEYLCDVTRERDGSFTPICSVDYYCPNDDPNYDNNWLFGPFVYPHVLHHTVTRLENHPPGCSFEDVLNTGECRLSYAGLTDLVESEIVLKAAVGTCSSTPQSYHSYDIVCEGQGCMEMHNLFRDSIKLCSDDDDCDGTLKCHLEHVEYPRGGIFPVSNSLRSVARGLYGGGGRTREHYDPETGRWLPVVIEDTCENSSDRFRDEVNYWRNAYEQATVPRRPGNLGWCEVPWMVRMQENGEQWGEEQATDSGLYSADSVSEYPGEGRSYTGWVIGAGAGTLAIAALGALVISMSRKRSQTRMHTLKGDASAASQDLRYSPSPSPSRSPRVSADMYPSYRPKSSGSSKHPRSQHSKGSSSRRSRSRDGDRSSSRRSKSSRKSKSRSRSPQPISKY